jgi:thiamine biosynthesis protein ThiI
LSPTGNGPELPPPELVLVRYGELALKGGNRREFVEALVRNMKVAAQSVAPVKIHRERGRLLVRPERRVIEVAHRLRDVFGISSVSPAWSTTNEPEAIVELSRAVVADAFSTVPPGERRTFRVQSRRGEKRFPMTSAELDRHVAERVLGQVEDRVKVQLKNPEIVLGIDVRTGGTYVFVERLQGSGGLPVGTLGKALCLFSGGIDSPVAAWMTMKRGCEVPLVSFHAYPYIGESARRKVIDLARILARFQPRSRLFVVPFAPIQVAVRDQTPETYRTVLYRRMMQRIAAGIAEEDGCGALVTGESLGQVASQTLENITCIEAAADLPVLRPLIGFDKEETIRIAQRIGTFDLSSRAEPDCCTVFLPSRPVIRGRIDRCDEAESRIDVEGLVASAIAEKETLVLEHT